MTILVICQIVEFFSTFWRWASLVFFIEIQSGKGFCCSEITFAVMN